VTEKGMKTKQQRRISLTNDQMKVSSKVIFFLEKTNDFQHTWYKFPMKDIVSFSLGQQLNKSRETIFKSATTFTFSPSGKHGKDKIAFVATNFVSTFRQIYFLEKNRLQLKIDYPSVNQVGLFFCFLSNAFEAFFVLTFTERNRVFSYQYRAVPSKYHNSKNNE
jgi:hypothetical protein